MYHDATIRSDRIDRQTNAMMEKSIRMITYIYWIERDSVTTPSFTVCMSSYNLYMFINSSNSDDEKETIILPDNERERKEKRRKKQIVVYHHFLPIFFPSLCFLSMSFFLCLSIKPKKKKKKGLVTMCFETCRRFVCNWTSQ